jgi:threonyl-tRNA synthetase
MTRVYAWAYPSKEELDAHVEEYRRALEHDHKKPGRELDIFVIDDVVGPGLPLWLPNGTVLREELEKLAKELEFEAGYKRIATPVIARSALYYQSGHLPYDAEGMYPFMELEGEEGVKDEYALRPMYCPHHHRVYAARPRSYRDLPLPLAEYGNVFRYEDHGALSGLLRVRGMTMNDAHIYCTEEQITEEFVAVIEMHQRVYDILASTSSTCASRRGTRTPRRARRSTSTTRRRGRRRRGSCARPWTRRASRTSRARARPRSTARRSTSSSARSPAARRRRARTSSTSRSPRGWA